MRTSTVHATAATAAATVSENRSSSFWRRLTVCPPATLQQGPVCRRRASAHRACGYRPPRRGEDRAAESMFSNPEHRVPRGRAPWDLVPPQEHFLQRRAAVFREPPL